MEMPFTKCSFYRPSWLERIRDKGIYFACALLEICACLSNKGQKSSHIASRVTLALEEMLELFRVYSLESAWSQRYALAANDIERIWYEFTGQPHSFIFYILIMTY